MSDLQMLVEMGFSAEKAQKALDVTGNKMEIAMEWLLAHSDESEVAPECVSADSTNTAESAPVTGDAGASSSGTNEVAQEPQEVKSFKCEECNRLFKNQMEVEFHAAKSGHSNFSESTEEKKPLTEEEKKEQLARLEEKLRQKRLQREESEKREALEREKFRIKSGKDMSEAQRKIEEQEMKKLVEQRKREKQEDKMARERVKAQIEADKAARREQMALLSGNASPTTTATATPPGIVTIAEPSSTSSSSAAASSSSSGAPKTYVNTRIQIRLLNGSTLVETFDVKEQLSAVRLFIQIKQGIDEPFGLMTNFPRKVYSDEDYEKPLETLGLVPSAVLIVTKAK
ncbi:UBX domain-containing protein 1 [Sitodiplosis mosellana]|uniref:UBX domain-containing protein 1 n=1 Tax=Sitodiplosis mosellana TaxID=263140 RepID=UPI00244437A6|nr:UBX domain-containing protein 1 [Sitodiplosis mosellana]